MNSPEVPFLKSSLLISLKCLSWWFLDQIRDWATWVQKLGHQAKSMENRVYTIAVTFFNQCSWILLKMFVYMISRSSMKQGLLGSKTRSLSKIKRKLCQHSRGHIFEVIILLKTFVLMISRSSLKLGQFWSKSRSRGQIKGKPSYFSGHIF